MPLILLADKMHFLEGIYWPLVSEPSEATISALHLVMLFYGDMSRRIREADRTRKRGESASDEIAREAVAKETTDHKDDTVIHAVFENLRNRQNWSCGCEVPVWEESFSDLSDSQRQFSCRCRTCQREFGPIELSIGDLQGLREAPE